MEPSKGKNPSSEIQNTHQELTKQCNSDIKANFESETKQSGISLGLQIEIQGSAFQKPFAPLVSKTLQMRGDGGILPYAAAYNEKRL